jgi:hypothetical protein
MQVRVLLGSVKNHKYGSELKNKDTLKISALWLKNQTTYAQLFT